MRLDTETSNAAMDIIDYLNDLQVSDLKSMNAGIREYTATDNRSNMVYTYDGMLDVVFPIGDIRYAVTVEQDWFTPLELKDDLAIAAHLWYSEFDTYVKMNKEK